MPSAIYFCFVDDKFDKPEHPNKLVVPRRDPSVADFLATIKALFFPSQDVALSCSFIQNGAQVEFPENAGNPIPVNDRANVLVVKSRYQEGASKITPQSMQITAWLHDHQLDTLEIVTIFQRQKISLENMKFLKDTDLQSFGIIQWETRLAILDAIQKYYSQYAAVPTAADLGDSLDH
eukprot:TRINITY_DN1230_c0_g1_i2.p1 TRINITY_DN1230_c0_g1~~TRINITY_DN1230_c0_g1_i2.p1  ORF type:complete len:178 (-),score=14.97 TRINITY_DN1230_c0_g1_i2:135-668(-)